MAGVGQWIKSQMGTDQVKDADGYTYGLYKQLKDCEKYRCTKKRTPEYKCPATAFVERNTNPPMVLRVENEHNLGADVLNKDVRFKENEHIKALALAGEYFHYLSLVQIRGTLHEI